MANSLVFGGISGFPQGRGDTTYQYDDTLSWVHGKHSIRCGVEFRRFDNNNFNGGTGGVLNFGTMAGFLAGTPTSATETALPATPALRVSAFNAFVQDDVKISQHLTLNLGLRWEFNGVPSEIHNRLGFYDFTQIKCWSPARRARARPTRTSTRTSGRAWVSPAIRSARARR